MPLTDTGKKVLASMKRTYGSKKGEQVFHASINKGKPGTPKFHVKRKNAARARAVLAS